MKKGETFNTFPDGLIMDLGPLQMPNSALTNCLNGTLLTQNGEENTLLNDMGNARVETAMLPTGYIPLGSASFGGIVYIVSYNPIDKKCLIGSFPSPERNLSKDEMGDDSNAKIDFSGFCTDKWQGFKSSKNIITSYYLKINLLNKNIHSGDKYKVFSDKIAEYYDYISGWHTESGEPNTDPNLYPKYLKFEIVSTLNDGKVLNLTDNSIWTAPNGDNKPYYIYNGGIQLDEDTKKVSLEEYRGLVGSNYDTYSSKLSGLLGLIAKLEVPTSFTSGYRVLIDKKKDSNKYKFYYFLNWSNDNIGSHKNRINPSKVHIEYKFKYLDLDNSNVRVIPPDKNIELEHSEGTSISNSLDNVDYYTLESRDFSEYLLSESNKFDISTKRKNDGTDFPYIIKSIEIELKNGLFYYNGNKISNDVTIEFTPVMPFGKLDFLKNTLLLDLLEIESGNIYFNNYLYYVEENKIYIDFSILAYPEEGKELKSLSIMYLPLEDAISDSKWRLQSTYEKENNDIEINNSTLVINSDPTGLLHIEIDRKDPTKGLINDKIYLIHFIIKYGKGEETENRIFSRLLFNNTIFNNAYGQGLDFKDLYLYDNEVDYGLKLNIDLDNNANPTYTLLSPDIDKYKDLSIIENPIKEYKITNTIDSLFKITSNMLEEVKLEINEVKLLETNIESLLSSKENVILNAGELNSRIINKNYLNLSNLIDVKIPYEIKYNKVRHIPIYKKDLLKECGKEYDSVRHRVVLRHKSSEKKEGTFGLIISSTNDLKRDGVRTEEQCPDETKNLKFYLDNALSLVLNLMNKYEYDYATILFGVLFMHDNNCGYGYRLISSNVHNYFWKFEKKPRNHYNRITAVRKGDGLVFIHKNLLDLLVYFNYDSKASEDENYDDIMEIIRKNDRNYFDSAIIPSLMSDANLIYYTKYVKTSLPKDIYYIDDINYAENPIITVIYNLNFEISSISIKIGNYNIDLSLENLVNNLRIKNLLGFSAQMPINIEINNVDWTDLFITTSFKNDGWDFENDKLIPEEDLYKVYIGNDIVSNLSINDKGFITVSEDFIDKSIPTEWYFGWEDTGGKTRQNPISIDLFEDSKQYYSIGYTYAIKDIVSDRQEVEVVLEYDIVCDTLEYIKDKLYELQISRESELTDRYPREIIINCIGGDSIELSFLDDGTDKFEITIHVTPREEECTVNLMYEGTIIETFIFNNVIEKDTDNGESD